MFPAWYSLHASMVCLDASFAGVENTSVKQSLGTLWCLHALITLFICKQISIQHPVLRLSHTLLVLDLWSIHICILETTACTPSKLDGRIFPGASGWERDLHTSSRAQHPGKGCLWESVRERWPLHGYRRWRWVSVYIHSCVPTFLLNILECL